MISKGKTIAICVDLQEKLVPAMCSGQETVSNSIRLINGLRNDGVPILVTQQYTKGLGQTLPEVREALGTDDYIEKISYSCYPVVEDKLAGPEECPYVLVFGIESHVCVLQTAIELKEKGYKPVLVADCISSRKQKDIDLAIIRAQQEGILITSYEAVLFEINRTAGTPEAKALNKIVK